MSTIEEPNDAGSSDVANELIILPRQWLEATGDIAKFWIAHGHSFPGMVS